mgnify:CR=1 FL=1
MKRKIDEATGASSAGKFKVPIVLAPQLWKNDQLGPFTEPVYHYRNAELAYEEADGDFKESPEQREVKEYLTDKVSEVDMYLKKFYTYQNDDEGSNLGQLEDEPSNTIEEQLIKEDLGVWFGTKKKPKGSKQPKGPWVNICRKVNGKHPPCGRPEAKSTGYPKCRAVHVASKMTASQKRAACQQKRKAEKTHSKIGTGNKPKMTSYKPKNESIDKLIRKIIKEVFEPTKLYPVERIYSKLQGAPIHIKMMVRDLDTVPCKNKEGVRKMCAKIPHELYQFLTKKN